MTIRSGGRPRDQRPHVRRYEPEAGLGTLMARLFPFVVPFWVAWAVILLVFYGFDLPLGPGNDIHVQRG